MANVRNNSNHHRGKRIHAQTKAVRRANGLLFVIIVCAGALSIGLSYLPQKFSYEKKIAELQEAIEREEIAESRLESLQIKLDAIKNDPAFLEIQARDRLQVYRPGETIFRLER